ncbi:MAG: oligoendopeptidase F [Treponema sp.]|uniref:oligoendopeptidase F n=1 Tax=Treponema sp. TaxID=166 RepID=UPI0025CD0122|nr:oligoendopeptidase F [Treponema sp.]MBQ8681044.1 oligoendopeptidase F [Treponema sp.]
MAKNSIPTRNEVPASDKWDLSTLYKSDEDWEKALSSIKMLTEKVVAFKGKLGDSSDSLLGCLKAIENLEKVVDTVHEYAGLQHTADESDAAAQDREGRAMMAASNADSETSFFSPELMAIPDEKINEWKNLPEFADYKIFLEKELHHKPYILSEKEERILSLQSESSETAYKAFSMLTNVDLQFESVRVNGEEKPLTQSTYSVYLHNPDREVRKQAYKNFYKGFVQHENTIASLYAGSVNQDVFTARARGYKSSLEAALYGNKVPESVYRNLIDTVHKNLPTLHKYYSLRKKILGVEELRHYDVYVPLVKNVECKTSYDEAVEICRAALSPLGKEYTDTLCSGLKGGWVDRYENKGKRSGAFSSGAYTGYPYILLNYKEDSIRDLFTMAHEGGHSMHSYFSKTNNPFMCYNYTIFEAEVASTFNEELVFEYLLREAKTPEMRAYLISMRADDILATLHRQTMFAEFELKAHELVESGTPLSAQVLRKIYRELLEQYFGPEMVFEEESDMEGLRIPHFYGAFYVYKYATGISAALALAKRVTGGGEKEREDYFKFLKSGGSRYPIESLKVAGVDMSSSEPVQAALDTFADLVSELEKIL